MIDSRRSGVSIVELVVASAVLGLLAVAIGSYTLSLSKAQQLDRRRWWAYSNLQSFVDVVSSLPEAKLHQLIDAQCVTPAVVCPESIAANSTLFLSNGSLGMSWLSQWEEAGLLQNLRLSFQAFKPFPTKIVAPFVETLDAYDIEITAFGDFVWKAGEAPKTIQRSKRIYR